jgi:pimeloyl-ACP methyl ester carboxylesterase
MSKIENVILVHGAWVDGSSWSKVILLLKDRGLSVTAVQLPLTSLKDDCLALERAIALQNGLALLVGHSYGGVVITEVGDHPKVSGLVYIAGFAPDIGESAGALLANAEAMPLGAELRPDALGYLRLSHDGIYKAFAADVDEQDKYLLFTTQAPISLDSLGGSITRAGWRQNPSWYLITEDDQAISPALQRTMAKEIGALKTVSVASSHAAMMSHPAEVADLILLACNAAGEHEK